MEHKRSKYGTVITTRDAQKQARAARMEARKGDLRRARKTERIIDTKWCES